MHLGQRAGRRGGQPLQVSTSPCQALQMPAKASGEPSSGSDSRVERDALGPVERFRRETGLFSNGAYDLPSAGNPRLAGGMHWTGADYAAFLRALQGGQLLGPRLLSQMYADHVGSALIGSSPPLAALGEDWHYGFGHWLECPSPTFDCPAPAYHSSPGAYGAYPFVNVAHGYFGIVALSLIHI